ncbi:hypothetical protein B0T18DRAFT_413366 [Schizothecium vesticola]|uniref:Uncharacterized protein n=1 Tax=Schizothecium vesticola TaxID=314040 RepID=A0AA40ENJ4_9PEZI|nr:hypothetical protein B0T18DRAFT_413366 [Schizothecium vesticola]
MLKSPATQPIQQRLRGYEAPVPQPKKRGRPPKDKNTVPDPKRQRATPKEGPLAAVVGVGIASQATVGQGGQTTRSGRQVRLTKKAAARED